MPRPVKCRKVCSLPAINIFSPSIKNENTPEVIMSIDEYETIRLIDNENLSQEECSLYMNIARTTVQQIYESARKKIAEAIVNGCVLKIQGGNYVLCDKNDGCCCRRKCCRQNIETNFEE